MGRTDDDRKAARAELRLMWDRQTSDLFLGVRDVMHLERRFRSFFGPEEITDEVTAERLDRRYTCPQCKGRFYWFYWPWPFEGRDLESYSRFEEPRLCPHCNADIPVDLQPDPKPAEAAADSFITGALYPSHCLHSTRRTSWRLAGGTVRLNQPKFWIVGRQGILEPNRCRVGEAPFRFWQNPNSPL
jgi:hypothetical protein